jgi:UDP-N-acetylglucosamine diphosphorylase/glucosamine-1-phosphate N-acetyltransferase
MKLYLFDDRVSDTWHPFSLTRPCSELLFGTSLLRERLERFAGRPTSSVLSRPWLEAFKESDAPTVIGRGPLSAEEERLVISSRFVPSAEARFEGRGNKPVLLTTDDEVVGCYLPAGTAGPEQSWLETPDEGVARGEWGRRSVDGGYVDTAWRFVAENPGRLAADLAREAASRGGVEELPEGTWKLGSHALILDSDVLVEPGVVFDTRDGPVRLAERVEVRAGCRLEGPLYVGPSTILLGGAIGTSSIGPVCRLRGEIEESVILGFTNKAHDGFLGHSYLGRWVNLGAMTTNSDLKNTYGPVRIGGPDGPIDTGLRKLGCLVGDHVKTAIGTLVNTGTVVGAGSNLFGGPLPPTWVPPFSWGSEPGGPVYDRDRFLALAQRVLERRDVEFNEGTSEWLASCWDAADRGDAV